MIKAYFVIRGDAGEYNGDQEVGYFDNQEEAKKALRGLCPWDFNPMWGSGYYDEFKFEEVPGRLDEKKDAQFIAQREDNLRKAREHAEKWAGSCHHRAPDDWS